MALKRVSEIQVIQEVENCKVEYHTVAGVLYVHSPYGQTLIRISGLQPTHPFKLTAPTEEPHGLLDIHIAHDDVEASNIVVIGYPS